MCFPVAADPAPHHDVFADDFLRRLGLCFQCDCADFARSSAAQRQHVERRQPGIAELPDGPSPEGLYGRTTLDDIGAGRQA